LAYLSYTLTVLGELESIVFKGVGPAGFDIYALKFARGAVQVRLSVAADGKLEGLSFRPEGDGSAGAVVACSQEATLRPSTGTVPITMTFVNRSGTDVRLYRVDFSGKRVAVSTILDEQSTPIGVMITQPLVITDLSDRCLQVVLPGAGTSHIAITEGPSVHTPAARNRPLPGSEAALRHLIDSIRRGDPDYSRMSKQAANGIRQQLGLIQAIMGRAGSIEAISFVGVGRTGQDIYRVKSENGSAEVRLDLLKDGRIGSISLGPE
jgi:hypothetical protein